MHITFVHDSHSFLPEISAYRDFFSSRGVTCAEARPARLHTVQTDVLWHFMGADRLRRIPGRIVIHEYTSASVPPLAACKNLYKKLFNARPDYRLFLNGYVRDALGFRDEVPHGLRDMGIPASWLRQALPPKEKQYDFVYAGEWKRRGIERLLDLFSQGSLRAHSLLIVSKDYEPLTARYAPASNITFTGPVPHNDVRTLIGQARYAINFMPDKPPFNRQTSTKLLEYASCQTPVITSDYEWVRGFQQQYGGRFFYLAKDLSNLSWAAVQQFDYGFPDLSAWTWEQQLLRSGVVDFLSRRFPGAVS